MIGDQPPMAWPVRDDGSVLRARISALEKELEVAKNAIKVGVRLDLVPVLCDCGRIMCRPLCAICDNDE